MANVIESLKDADMVVFASPIYWFDITAQEKAAIDRLYAFGATGFPFTKTAFLLDSHSEGVYDAAIAMYTVSYTHLDVYKRQDLRREAVPKGG